MIGELVKSEINEFKSTGLENFRNIKPEKAMSANEIKTAVRDEFKKANFDTKHLDNQKADKIEGLSDKDKVKIKEETGWSKEIIDFIENLKQYEIYKDAGLHEKNVNGRKCLVKDIDGNFVDPKTGMTNRERMENGWSPIDAKTGEKIELHHMGQKSDSPFAELRENSEHGDGKHATLHTKTVSWRTPELNKQYNNIEKPNHWRERATEV